MSKQKQKENQYPKVTIESAEDGWIVKEAGKPTQVYTQWRNVILRLEHSLTTYDDSLTIAMKRLQYDLAADEQADDLLDRC